MKGRHLPHHPPGGLSKGAGLMPFSLMWSCTQYGEGTLTFWVPEACVQI